jgi:hypothetical protein
VKLLIDENLSPELVARCGFMINRVVEVMSAREIRVREIPPGEA